MNDHVTISFYQLMKEIPDAEHARVFLESRRWKTGRQCPYCGHSRSVARGSGRTGYYRCTRCGKEFTVRSRSVFERSHIPLDKWILAVYMVVTARKGISSVQISKEIGITQKSAWFMMHRIRESMRREMHRDMFRGIVEMDETYIGGLEDNKHSDRKLRAGRGAVGKIPVFGIRQRGGNVRAFVVKAADKPTLQSIIRCSVRPGSTLNTDEARMYCGLEGRFKHRIVNHSAKQFVDGMAYTNSIESVWAVLKRGFYGIFHKFSLKHLQRYVDEFDFRLNEGRVGFRTEDRMESLFRMCWGCRIDYRALTEAA